MKARRGFTIAETLVVAVIISMLLAAVAAAMGPLFSAAGDAQVKTDTLGPATTGLYVLERDIRQSDANGVFACTDQPAMCGDGTSSGGISAIAIATALGSGEPGAWFMTQGGSPDWQGYLVYWMPDSGGVVYRAYEPVPGLAALINTPQPDRAALRILAQAAVAAAVDGSALGGAGSTNFRTSRSSAVAMRYVASISASVNAAAGDVSLQVITASSGGGHGNSSTFNTDVVTRN